MRTLIAEMVESTREFQVVGTASDGVEAIESIRALDPDIVTLDIEMPRLDGLQTLDTIMRELPRPVVMLSAAGSAAWLRSALGVPHAVLDAEAARWTPGTDGLLFAPYLAGERTPYPDPDARGAFTGLELRHDRGALWRAMLEGVAYGLRDSLELLRALGVRPEVGRISGGGARSAVWVRIVASVLGLPLERTASEEGSAFGAALLAGVRAGTFADAHDAVERCVQVTERIEPEPEWVEAYAQGYARYRLLYPTLSQLKETT